MNGQDTIWLLRERRQRRQRAKGGAGTIVLRLTGGLALALLLSVAFVILAAVGTVVGVYAYYAKDLPDPNEIVTAPGNSSRRPRSTTAPARCCSWR